MSEGNGSLVIRYDPKVERKVSEDEKEYRLKEYPNEQKFLKRKTIECSSCGKEVRKKIVNNYELYIHPALEVIICFKCEDFYNDGEFSVDEDGSDKYCRWCGQGGELYCCSFCSVAICAVCVKRNLPKWYNQEIERDDWRCFVCDPKPIWSFRALCHAAKQYVENHKQSKTSKRSRTVMASDYESDDELTLERKKKSKIDVASDKENEQEELENRKSSRVAQKKSKVPKTRDESDESPTRTKTKTRGLKTRAGKPHLPSRNQKNDDSDESSGTSTSRRSLRTRPSRNQHRNVGSDVSSSASSPRRRSSRNKSHSTNVESDDSTFVSPSKKGSTKKNGTKPRNTRSSVSTDRETRMRRSGRASCSQSSTNTDKNLVKLALIDNMNDFRQCTAIITKIQDNFEKKYLENESQDDDFWLKAKDKYSEILDKSVEHVLIVQETFYKLIEKLEENEKLVNGDKTPGESELNGDKTPEKERNSKNEVNHEPDVEMTETHETSQITDTDAEMETPIDQNPEEMSTECADTTQEQLGEITTEPAESEKIEEKGDTADLNPDELPVSSSDQAETTCRSVDESKEEDVCEGSVSESTDTPKENGDVPEKDEMVSESKNTEAVDEKDELQFTNNCEVRLEKISEPYKSADAEPLSEEHGKNEESDTQSATLKVDTGDTVEAE